MACECQTTYGHRRQVILIFLSWKYKYSRRKHSLLFRNWAEKGSHQGQTYLQVTWPQNDTAAVWPLMTGTWARLTHRPTNSVAGNLFVPAQCVQTFKRLSALCDPWIDHKGKKDLLSSLGSKYVLIFLVSVSSAPSCDEMAQSRPTCFYGQKLVLCVFF